MNRVPFEPQLKGRTFQAFVDTTLAQNAVFRINFEELASETARKYMPFTSITLQNQSDETIEFDINEGQALHRLAAKQSKVLSEGQFRVVKITNKSTTTTTANEIWIEAESEQATVTNIQVGGLFQKILGA